MDSGAAARAMETMWAEAPAANEAAPGRCDADVFSEERLRRACADCGIEPDRRDQMLAARAEICASPTLLRAAQHCYYVLFGSREDASRVVGTWPAPSASSPAGLRLFYAVICLAGVSEVRARHAGMGIDSAVTWATMSDIRLWLRETRPQGGGLLLDNIGWLARHCQCRLFRLGRLQIELSTYPGTRSGRVAAASDAPQRTARATRTVALRHSESGCVIAVETDGGESDVRGSEWLSGQLVHPRGETIDVWRRFALDCWEVVLAPGDGVAVVHVPADGVMGWSDIVSFTLECRRFLGEHFPDAGIGAFYLKGWPLDPLLERLPSSFAIVRLRSLLYCLPVGAAGPARDRRTTSAQRRAIAVLMKSGDGSGLAGGAGFYLLDDVASQEVSYRQAFEAWLQASMSSSSLPRAPANDGPTSEANHE